MKQHVNAGKSSAPQSKTIKKPALESTSSTKKIIPDLQQLSWEGDGNILAQYDSLRVTAEKFIPENPPLVTWNGAGIAARGNITAVSAASKAGKTAFILAIVVGLICLRAIEMFKNLFVAPNINSLALIMIDTEQSEYDLQLNLKTILKRLGVTDTPPYFLAYNFRQLLVGAFKDTLSGICEAAQEEFGGIHAIVIDGGADFIKSVNDEESSYDIVQYFTHLGIQYNCPVIVVVHQNPGTDKERGHFGSQIQRKCYGLVSISKENGVSKAEAKMMRRGDASTMEPIYFSYNAELGYHTEVDAPIKESKGNIEYAKLKRMAEEAFSNGPLKYSDAVTAIMGVSFKSERTAKTYLQTMGAWKIIEQKKDGTYGLKIS